MLEPKTTPQMLTHLMAAHRSDLQLIYANSLYLVDQLRMVFSMLDGRAVALTDEERGWLEKAYETIGDIQERIESRIPLSHLD